MAINKIYGISFLSLALIACGGGGGPSNSDEGEGDTTITEGGTNVTTGTDLSTQVPALGVVNEGTYTDAIVDVGVSELSAGGSTSISVNIVDTASSNAVIVGAQYGVRFSSECAELDPPKATFQDDELLTTNGSVSTFYKAEGCSGEDRITATLFAADAGSITGEAVYAALGAVTVALAEVNNIEFVDAVPSTIALKGLGFTALPETSAISFAVKDEFNNPISGKTVNFKLSNNSVGVTLAGDADLDGAVDGLTDGSGIATAYVNSGSSHASISVKATTAKNSGGTIGTQSFPVAITTGVVDQNSFNLVIETRNPHSWDIDGTEVDLSVRGSDAFQNPIPDGTVINFMSESGQILPSCVISNGGCSVKWTSTNPRPGVILDPSKSDGSLLLKTNAVGFPGYDAAWQGGRAGVATILAYTLGEAGFPDSGGNGLLDVSEPYYGLAEAFLDANEDGNFDPGAILNPEERLIDFDSNGVQTAAPSTYQGASCSAGAIAAGHCAELVHVRDTVKIIVADGTAATVTLTGISGSNTADLTNASCIDVREESPVTFNFNVADSNGNIPPIDTGIAFTAEGFELVGSAPSNVPEGFSTTGINYSVSIKEDDTFENGIAIFEVNSLTGDITSWDSQTLTDDPRILVSTDSYILDVSAGAQSQSVVYTFADACGNPPDAADIILFELANGLFTEASIPVAATNKYQFSGADLNGSGQLTIVYEDDGAPTVDGDVKVTTLKAGITSTTTYTITD